MDTAYRQIKALAEFSGERIACLEARHHLPWYLHGVAHSGYYKQQLVHVETLEDVEPDNRRDKARFGMNYQYAGHGGEVVTREQEALTVQRVLDGNADEYEKLVLEYQKNVYNLALRMTGDPEDAADMAQEAFIKAYSSLSGYRGDSKFSVWLYRIVSNVCLDFLRAKKRRQTVSLSVTDDDGEDTELDIADESKSPERIFERAMTRDAVRRGLAALTPEYRQILILPRASGHEL